MVRQTIFVLKPKIFWNNIILVYSYGIKCIQNKNRGKQKLNPNSKTLIICINRYGQRRDKIASDRIRNSPFKKCGSSSIISKFHYRNSLDKNIFEGL